jgi:hypothetical protein
MQRGPLGLAKPYPVTDPRQFFDGDTVPGAFSLGHDAFGDLVIDVGGEPGLLATALLQEPPRRAGFLGLQPFPQPHLPFPVAVESGTGRLLTGAGGGDVDDAHVNTEKAVSGLGQRGFGCFDGGV